MSNKIPILDEKDLNALIQQALNGDGVLVTPKEINQMIKNIPGVSICSKPRKDGRYQGYIVDGNGKTYVYGKSIDEVTNKLKHFLRNGTPRHKNKDDETFNGVPTTFTPFAHYYFENFRKRKVAEQTYKVDIRRFNKYLAPYFAKTPIKKITPLKCQNLIENLSNDGKGKTADEIHALMSVIFKSAIQHGILQRNPLDVIYHEKHERKSGKALTKDEELTLKTALIGSDLLPAFMLALYTGLRPNEYNTAHISENFIIAVNSKRKNKKVEYKRIPIIKALMPYVQNSTSIKFNNYILDKMRRTIKNILPNHILYDLRTTFYSRCKEFGVSEYAINEFMGHSLGPIGNAYTDLSNEFLTKEGKKLDTWE